MGLAYSFNARANCAPAAEHGDKNTHYVCGWFDDVNTVVSYFYYNSS